MLHFQQTTYHCLSKCLTLCLYSYSSFHMECPFFLISLPIHLSWLHPNGISSVKAVSLPSAAKNVFSSVYCTSSAETLFTFCLSLSLPTISEYVLNTVTFQEAPKMWFIGTDMQLYLLILHRKS